MYNRYTPQSDGSYRRNRLQEPNTPKPQPSGQSPSLPVEKQENWPTQSPQHSTGNRKPDSISGFFKQLLPKNLETADLLILLLLLLMAGDREEDRNNALLTMALYFFM